MQVYTVHERPTPLGAEPDVVLVKEGFSWPAFLVPLLWALYHRLWLGLLVYGVAATALGALVERVIADEVTGLAATLGFALLVGFEANDWRRRSLGRHGYRFVGVVAAPSLEAAERRHFSPQAARP